MPLVAARIRFITTVHATTVDIAALECYNTRKETECMNKKVIIYIILAAMFIIILIIAAVICFQSSTFLSEFANIFINADNVNERDYQNALVVLDYSRWLIAGGVIAIMGCAGLVVSIFIVYRASTLVGSLDKKKALQNKIDKYQQQLDEITD